MKDDFTFPYFPYMSPQMEIQLRLSGEMDKLSQLAGKGERKYNQAELDNALLAQEERVYRAFNKVMQECMDKILENAKEEIIQRTADEIMRRLRQEQQAQSQADKQDDDELETAIMELDFES